MKVSSKIGRVAVLALICAAYGSMTGFFSHASAKQPLILIDTLPYQNSAIAIGAGVGIVVFLLAYGIYYLLKRLDKTDWYGSIFLICIIAGIAIGFISSYVVHISADNFGLINGSTASAMFNGGVAAFFGGSAGLGVAIVINEN